MLQVGAFVALVKKVPIAKLDASPLGVTESDTCCLYLATFLADFFAFVLGQGCQECVKVGIPWSGVGPVKLHRLAQHDARVGTGSHVVIGPKQQVQ